MASLFDFAVILDDRMIVRHVEWYEHFSSPKTEARTADWAGLSLLQLPETQWDLQKKSLLWLGERFTIERCTLPGGTQCIFARREDLREKLLEGALDAISDSVQIYDAELRVVYYNRVFRSMMDLSDNVDVQGEKLLDIFDVDENYSTTITALQTKRAVKGRYDQYKSTTGKELQTVNAAFPVMKDGRLLGAVSIERNMETTKKLLAELDEDQRTLAQHQAPAVHPRGALHYALSDLIGSSPKFTAAVVLARKMAGNESSILLQGETGTGDPRAQPAPQAEFCRRQLCGDPGDADRGHAVRYGQGSVYRQRGQGGASGRGKPRHALPG